MPRRTPKTLRDIPEAAWFAVLDKHEDRIIRLLDDGVARIFRSVDRASETLSAWEQFIGLLAARLAVGGDAEKIIAKAAKDALAMTGLTANDGVGALAAFPVPDEVKQAGLARYTQSQASNYLSQRSGTLVREIDGKTVRGLRHLLAGSNLLESDPPRRVLDAIGDLVGLTNHQGKEFLNVMDKRVRAGTIRTEGDVVKLFRRHVRRRARTIVETEAGQAVNAGIQASYKAMRDEMGIPMRGENGVFTSVNGETSRGPLLHVRCRCGTRLFFFDGVYWVQWVTRITGACPQCIAFDAALKGWEAAQFGEAA